MVMRQGVREIAGLPADTLLLVYYTEQKFKGLGIPRVKWETSLQHLNMCQTLSRINDTHLKIVRDLEKEIIDCRKEIRRSFRY